MRHVNFTLGEVELEAAAGGEGAPDAGGRRIAGLAVPYDLEAEIDGLGRVEFAPGSIEFAPRVPMLLGHDRNRPVGVMAEKIDSSSGVYATFRIDRTSDGDAALEQAASGSRAGLSVGADVHEFESLEDGELTRVTLARVTETSLVSLAAFDTAAVDAVAAAKHNPNEGAEMSTSTELEQAAAEAPATVSAEAPAPVEPRPPVLVAERAQAPMRAGEYVKTYIAAQKGDAAARGRIEAALTREVIGNEPGVVPVAYAGDLVDGLGADRPLFSAFSSAPMPSSGMTIRRPSLNTRPNGAWLADDTAGAPSSAVTIGNLDVPVLQWAFGAAASIALVERSDPSYVEIVYSQAIKDYYRDVEAKIAAELVAIVAGAATTLGGAVAAYMGVTRTYPNVIIAGGVAAGKIIDALGALRYSSGSADASGTINMAGLRVVVSPDVTPADAWITHTDYIENRETSPIRLSVSDVTGLSVEFGVTSFFSSLPGLVPGGVARIAGFVPAVEGAQQTSSKSKS